MFFENVTVEGNIILENDSFDLARLAAEGVKNNNGTTYNLKGKKVFKNTLIVKRLETIQNNEIGTHYI